MLSLTIYAGDHMLNPAESQHEIDIYVSGGDPVQGLELFLQIADGGVEAGGGIDGPVITDVDLKAGIFAVDAAAEQTGSVIVPQVAQYGITTSSLTSIPADGLLATVTIDISGFAASSPTNPWELKLSSTLAGNSNFPGVATHVINGSIAIAGNPTIIAGHHFLRPNMPGQQIEIEASGGGLVSGAELFLQVADGGPPAGGTIEGPAITGTDLLTDTIFAGSSPSQTGSVIVPQVAQFGTTTTSGITVEAQGLLATATVDTTGFLADNSTWSFKLKPTVAGNSSFPGLPTCVINGTITLDGIAPTVALDAPAASADPTPGVTVTVADNQRIPDGTLVQVDVDLNHDGQFDGPGEQGYTTASLTANTAFFELTPRLDSGSYGLRARVADQAGNEGASDLAEVYIVAGLQGTSGDDTIIVQPGIAGSSLHRVTINGTLTIYDPAVYEAFSIDGLGGNDTISVIATTGIETASLNANSVNMLGPAYEVTAASVETIYVYGSAGDTANLTGDAAGNNTFKGRPAYSELQGPNSYHYVSGFNTVTATPGGGSNNRALLYGSTGADVLTASASAATIDWNGVPSATATGFNEVLAFGAAGDSAALTGNGAGGNALYGRPAYTELKSPAFYLYAGGFDTVTATPGGGNNNRALLYGGTGADTFTATPTSAVMDLAGAPSITATGFNMALGFGGSGDTANLTGDSAGGNFLQSRIAYTNMSGASYYYFASGFQTVTAASGGGTNNRAFFYNDPAASSLTADPTSATMDWNGTSSATVSNFNRVFGFGSTGDTAAFTGNSGGNNTFEGRRDYNALTGTGYYHYANGFDSVDATAGGGTNNRVFLYGGTGADTLSAGPTTGTMTWNSGRVAQMSGFDKVFGYGSIGDTANLTGDATATNTFDGYSTYSTLYSAAFYHYVSGFDLVTATAGSATNDRANLYDSVLDDLFTSSPGSGQMDYGDDASTDISVLAFERIHARFLNGGNDDANLTDSAAVDQFIGSGANGQLTDAAAYWVYLYFDSLGTDTVTLHSSTTGNTINADSLDYVLNYGPAYWDEI